MSKPQNQIPKSSVAENIFMIWFKKTLKYHEHKIEGIIITAIFTFLGACIWWYIQVPMVMATVKKETKDNREAIEEMIKITKHQEYRILLIEKLPETMKEWKVDWDKQLDQQQKNQNTIIELLREERRRDIQKNIQ